MRLGQRVQVARRRAGFMTCKDGAKALKMSKSSLGDYEQERREPGAQAIRTMARGFGVSSDYLLGL